MLPFTLSANPLVFLEMLFSDVTVTIFFVGNLGGKFISSTFKNQKNHGSNLTEISFSAFSIFSEVCS